MLSKRPVPRHLLVVLPTILVSKIRVSKILGANYSASLTGRGRSGIGDCGTDRCGGLSMAERGHRLGELKRVRGGAAIRRESDAGAAPALPIVAQ